jgi:alkanesulfonate monooxygenase SsuD/methylene tetrahydromethanopterin reductase-like flavin-dependent oxidoreductase (luciferase family)
MDVGVGLPATIRGVERTQILEWARRAEARGFSSLGTIDRIVYGNYEPLIALAAAAAVTERIRLATTILIAPYRANAVLLAKQAASVDHLSGGRLVLGMAVGGREDDYAASGVPFHQRGKQFDAMLDEMERAWRGDSFGHAGAIGPAPPSGRPAVVIGGTAEAAFRRAAHFDGWIMGGGTPDMFRQGAEQLQTAWRAAGRDTTPRTMALAYFALGDRAQAAAESYLLDYYDFLGEYAGQVAASAATDAATVRGYVDGFAAAGCDELVLFPCDPDPAQVDLLADALA